MICSVEGCGREAIARGLCRKCYNRKSYHDLNPNAKYFKPSEGIIGRGGYKIIGGKAEHLILAERALGRGASSRSRGSSRKWR